MSNFEIAVMITLIPLFIYLSRNPEEISCFIVGLIAKCVGWSNDFALYEEMKQEKLKINI